MKNGHYKGKRREEVWIIEQYLDSSLQYQEGKCCLWIQCEKLDISRTRAGGHRGLAFILVLQIVFAGVFTFISLLKLYSYWFLLFWSSLFMCEVKLTLVIRGLILKHPTTHSSCLCSMHERLACAREDKVSDTWIMCNSLV